MVLTINCVLTGKEPLRMPGITRNYCKDEEFDVVIELPENIFSLEEKSKVNITVGVEKDKCIKDYDFCGVGYVVSITKLDDEEKPLMRAIISIGGLLLIIKTRNKRLLDLKVIEKYYIGIKKQR